MAQGCGTYLAHLTPSLSPASQPTIQGFPPVALPYTSSFRSALPSLTARPGLFAHSPHTSHAPSPSSTCLLISFFKACPSPTSSPAYDQHAPCCVFEELLSKGRQLHPARSSGCRRAQQQNTKHLAQIQASRAQNSRSHPVLGYEPLSDGLYSLKPHCVISSV